MNSLTSKGNQTLDVSEGTALNMVWKAINSKPEGINENMKYTLAKQLSSVVENGSPSCSMGKIERIVQTLEGVDDKDIISTKPTPVLREEIGSKAHQIRTELEKNGYDSEVAKTKFKEEINKEYVGKLNMSPRIIEPIINEFKEGF